MKEKQEIKDVALALAQAGFDKKGTDIAILDLEGLSSLADYFVLVSASNVKQAQSIADEIEDKGAEVGATVLHREGYHEGEWICLISAILSVMSSAVRKHVISMVWNSCGMMRLA